MWYAEEGRAKAFDVRSAVERLHSTLNDLEFDAAHEIVYGLERWETNERLTVLQNKYSEGIVLCQKFLDSLITIEALIQNLCDIDLKHLIGDVEKYWRLAGNDGASGV